MKKAVYFLILIFLMKQGAIMAQQDLVDSLVKELKNSKEDTTRFKLLEELSDNAADGEWQKYNEQMGSLALKLMTSKESVINNKAKKYYGVYLNNKAFISAGTGNYSKALEYYLECSKIYSETGDLDESALILNNAGAVFDRIGETDKALENYKLALAIQEKSKEYKNLSATLCNVAVIYGKKNDPEKQFEYYNKSLSISKAHQFKNQIVTIVLRGLGDNMLKRRKFPEALVYFKEGMTMAEEIGDKSGLSSNLAGIAKVYFELNQKTEALKMAERALSVAREIDYPLDIADAAHVLAKLYEEKGDYKPALNMFKTESQMRDSLNRKENQKAVLRYQYQTEYNKKESLAKTAQEKKDLLAATEIQKQKFLRNGFLVGFATMLIFAAVVFRQRNKIKKAKQLSDELLLNILPTAVAEELKQKGSAEAKHFDNVTVMFTDFKDFTRISEKLSPAELVAEIHHCFKAFDSLMDKHNIEKIKTIGDSYMCVGGLPVPNKTNASDVVKAALEIQQFIQDYSNAKKKEGKEVFEIRIGIHTGPVVAGIVGFKKFAYDIWGDTVNIASRMESSGEAGKVNISDSTYELIKDEFDCTTRGKIEAKNKGKNEMYFVNRSLDAG